MLIEYSNFRQEQLVNKTGNDLLLTAVGDLIHREPFGKTLKKLPITQQYLAAYYINTTPTPNKTTIHFIPPTIQNTVQSPILEFTS